MSSPKFDPKLDLTPIPFNAEVCQLALSMKRFGLMWRPHVGCFVWDPDNHIIQTSPFPNRVYFILSMQRFLDIFGSPKNMVAKLVWLPTWHQARLLCRRLDIADNVIFTLFQQYESLDEDLKNIYRCICSALEK